MKDKINVSSPFKGKLETIAYCSDKLFAERAMGDGMLVTPSDNTIYAPMDGTVKMVFDTKHAFIIENGGLQLLTHIGIDTVTLKGAPFKLDIKQGDKVKSGQKIGTVDIKAIQKAKLPIETPILILPESPYEIAEFESDEQVDAKQIIMIASKK